MMKKLFWIIVTAFMVLMSNASAQTLPSGYIGRVLNNTPYTWQTYSFTFTAGTTGSNYFMLAFRQDPAYWSVDNVKVTAAGSTTNLLTNGDMTTGGGVSVNNGQQYIQAPTAWGVAYQNGTYPAAAGTWMNGGWYDGAVGSYDSIYQAVRLTAGITYTISFSVNGDNMATTTTTGWQLGVYAGTCGNVGLSPTECTLPSSSGFTQIATPGQTYTAGCTTDCPTNPDAAPTVVSTSVANQVTSSSSDTTIITSVSRSTATATYIDTYYGTTTVTTTTTTPVTTTTWSDGSTTTSNGTPTTTSTTTYNVTPTYGIAPIYSRTAPNTNGNSIYIKQVTAGNDNEVSVNQDGNNNAVTGTDSGWAKVNGNGNVLEIKQVGYGNISGVKMDAWGNNIVINQTANNNIFNLESAGNGNSATINQYSNGNTATAKMTWDINTINLTQKTGTNNQSYNNITGYWNTINTTQDGTNNLSIISLTGNNNSASVNQLGSNHSTLLNLIGDKNSVSVIQTGIGDAYSLQQTCTNPAGCAVSVIRNK